MRIKLNLLSLESRRHFLRLQLVYKIVYNINCPRQLQGYLVGRSEMHSRSLRDNILLHVVKTKTKMGQSSLKCAASKDWNELPQELCRVQSLSNFKTKVLKYLLTQFDPQILISDVYNRKIKY